MQENGWDPIRVFLSCFSVSSLCGLSGLLASGKAITVRSVVTALLYSGMLGLLIGLIWYQKYQGENNIYFLIGVSGLAGFGGISVLDFVMQLIAKGGVNITIKPKDDDPEK